MITTYLQKWEMEEFKTTMDPEINELLKEVREFYPIRIKSREVILGHKWSWREWCWQPIQIRLYTVFVGEGPEVQCFNFPGDGMTTRIEKVMIMTLLLGILNGKDWIIKQRGLKK